MKDLRDLEDFPRIDHTLKQKHCTLYPEPEALNFDLDGGAHGTFLCVSLPPRIHYTLRNTAPWTLNLTPA